MHASTRGQRHNRLTAAIVLGLCVGMGTVAYTPTAAAQVAEVKRYDLPAGTLDEALAQFGRQSGLQMLVPPELVAGHRVEAISGEFTHAAALERLLRGTGLSWERIPSGAVVIKRSDVAPQQPEREAQRQPVSSATDEEVTDIPTITVTGSHIRGAASAGSNVIIIDREDMENTGYATVQDVLKTIPQNFGASQQENTGGVGNLNRGTGANLRGLGVGATLTLINGRRPPASGDGDFVDVTGIPSSAIERIEILADGASAIYGSDAIGGVVNIILREEYDGAETQARYATVGGDSQETLFAQTLGKSWADASLLLGYQYYRRTALAIADRDYAASADKTPFGGTDRRNAFSNPGNIVDPTTFQPAYGIPGGQDGTNLSVSDLLPGVVNLQGIFDGADLLPKNETHSAYLVASRRFGGNFELFAEGRYSQRDFEAVLSAPLDSLLVPAANPFYVNPFGGSAPVRVNYSYIDDFGNSVASGETRTWTATIGGTWSIGSSWELTGSTSYGAERSQSTTSGIDRVALIAALADADPATAFNPFGDGSNTNPQTLDRIRSLESQHGDSSTWTTSVIGNGALFELPGGTARLAVGADYRQERLDSTRSAAELERKISAVFAELSLPLLDSTNAGASVPLLEASLAGRYEEYSDFGSTFNPKIGLRLAPIESLAFRGTWGTSFRAPRLYDLSTLASGGIPSNRLLPVPDPISGSSSIILLRQGNNPDLQEETATSWTAGVDFFPARLSGWRISATYYAVDYEDRIIRPGPVSQTSLLLQEALWPEIVTRNPSDTKLSEPCANLSSGSCDTTPPVAIVDQRLRNIARLKVRGVDLTVGIPWETGIGTFDFSFNGNYVLQHEQQLSRGSSNIDFSNTVFNPIDLRLRAAIAWHKGNFSANVATNYAGSYVDNLSIPNRRIDSWLTVDLGLVYRMPPRAGWLDGTEFAFRATNLSDEDPPFVDVLLGFDTTNASPLGRLLSFELKKTW